ncbi:hypothetical protein EVAR_38179_1 [Eumeta japonica]|uniref:Uncharacterized protein n=1 Tax=Eumeta variegata TaxID=151549 RepID=A0A4C1WE63_EUMVA|nr:hypothetical protein EVAR_38179_1 [Eumeta japonica]
MRRGNAYDNQVRRRRAGTRRRSRADSGVRVSRVMNASRLRRRKSARIVLQRWPPIHTELHTDSYRQTRAAIKTPAKPCPTACRVRFRSQYGHIRVINAQSR